MSMIKMKSCVIAAACAVSFLSAANGFAQSAQTVKKDSTTAAAAVKHLKPQTTCPIMGGDIDKKLFVDYKGKRIYVCCTGCLDQVKKDPEAAIKKLEALGQEPETIALKKKESTGIKADTSMKGMDMKGMKMSGDAAAKAAETGYWTCPMHPEVHKTASGQCPICGMNLVFKKSDKDTTKMKVIDRSKMK
jgi:hypothetical protein